MSEPRKINTSGSNTAGSQRSIHTGSASSSYADPRLEEARARARADAEAARMRRSQLFPRVTQQQAREGMTYLSAMEANLQALAQALQSEG